MSHFTCTCRTYGEATIHVRKNNPLHNHMSRWQGICYIMSLCCTISTIPNTFLSEAENRLHVMFDILAYIPVKHIQVCFMNSPKVLVFNQANKTPQQFQDEVHTTIATTFAQLRLAGTPILATLTRAFSDSAKHPDPTSHYLLTDGVPSDSSVVQLGEFIQHRSHPEKNPLRLISCTNVDSECEWMKEVRTRSIQVLYILVN